MLKKLFVEHPNSVGESYGKHLVNASGFAFRLIVAGCACFIHALLPFVFIKTGSVAITRLHEAMVNDRGNSSSE